VGPFYSIGCCRRSDHELSSPEDPAAVRIEGSLIDGAGEPITDGMVELFEPEGGRWGRSATGDDGRFWFVAAKPEASNGQAPHLEVLVFARGLLEHRWTRIYFPDEPAANAADPVLSSLADAERATLVAEHEDGGVRFDIRMQGDRQTVFFAP
jgi:protocatechuate 3,4-dioxygenase alpha subunit